MKTVIRQGCYQDSGEVITFTEVQEQISTGNGQTIPGRKTLYLDGNPITAANDEGTLFKDLLTGRLIKLGD